MYRTGNECRNNLHRNHTPKNHSIKKPIVNETVALQAFIRQDPQLRLDGTRTNGVVQIRGGVHSVAMKTRATKKNNNNKRKQFNTRVTVSLGLHAGF